MPVDIYGMNAFGHWVGRRSLCDLLNYRAVRWTPASGLVSLPVLPGTNTSSADDINDAGVAVGHCEYRACRWDASGTVSMLPNPDPGELCGAFAVNNSGVAVGWLNHSVGSVIRYAAVWSNGGITKIDPANQGFTAAVAYGVSDSNVVVGIFAGPTTFRGFRWHDGTTELLEPLAGAEYSHAKGVNDAGLVVGDSQFLGSNGMVEHTMPTVWDAKGIPTSLPILPPYTSGTCFQVNSSGVVLGVVEYPTDTSLPGGQVVIWVHGDVIPVQPLIQAAHSAAFGSANALNDSGQIIGNGPVTSGLGIWLLTPHAVPADLNGDCVVDGADLAELLAAWGPQAGPGSKADFNHDGKVDGSDLGTLLGAWSAQ